jgi:cytochrome b subunit of formate dehydrogenase
MAVTPSAVYPGAIVCALTNPSFRKFRNLLTCFAILCLFALPWARSEEAKSANPNAACLECHSDNALSMRKDGKKVSLFVDEAVFAKSVHKGQSCTDCHEDFDADKQPHKSPMAPVDCNGCHEKLGKSHVFHPRMALETIPKGTDTSCSNCHGTHGILPAKGANSTFTDQRQVDTCGRCHQQQKTSLMGSAHAKWQTPGNGHPPSCLDCHRKAIVGRIGAPADAALKLAQVQLCESCHVAKEEVSSKTVLGQKFVASFDKSVHGAALHAGKAEAAGCVDCHGSHETNPAMALNSRVNQQNVAATCSKCHEKQAAEFHSSVHATALAKGNLDSPTCTRCHGEHDIMAHKDPNAPVNAKNLSQEVCASCHASVRLSKRYGLSSDRFTTFSDSYHGLAVRGGSVEVVNCSSCHGIHGIKTQDDPTSSINKANLVQTCGHCHANASKGFTVGNVHANEKRAEQDPILYWVSTLYVLLIVVVIGGMAVHNLLDFFKKARRKLAIQKGLVSEVHVEHRLYLRMTSHERLQHAALVISFVMLVVTGFMLRYPEAWWVAAIQHLSARAFEWRGIIHRIAGVTMLVAGAWHCGYLAFTKPGRQLFWDLFPRWNDLTDPFKVVRYNLGLSKTKPRFERFCYIEKAEYWALIWGTLVMAVTGAILWFDNTSMGLITKLGFDIARAVHFYEAILATLAIIVWHFYFVIFNPDVYPMNLAWLTGRMSEDEMLEEHPAQLDRIKAEAARLAAEQQQAKPSEPAKPGHDKPEPPDFPA